MRNGSLSVAATLGRNNRIPLYVGEYAMQERHRGNYNNQGPDHYWLSRPERTVRALAATFGGLVHETTLVMLPASLRRSRLFQATIDRVLRITVELVGGVNHVYPPDEVNVQDLAVRKAVGNVVELASIVAVGWSPLWLLAAAADLTGGTRTYLRAFVVQLQRDGLLPDDADIRSVDELLATLQSTSTVAADTIDVPPLTAREMRRSLGVLRSNAAALPGARAQARLFRQLQEAAHEEGRSLESVSLLMAVGAVRAGAQLGGTYIFDYYREALRTILREGLVAYTRRVATPYLNAAVNHMNPQTATYTERLIQRVEDVVSRFR